MDPLKQRLRTTSGGRILDVATGTGAFVAELIDGFRSYRDAVGIDISPKLIEQARASLNDKNICFKIMDAAHLAFKDDTFDTVAIRHSLHHMRQVDVVLSEMTRVLKPGGLFIIREVVQDKKSKSLNPHTELHHWFAEIDRTNGVSHNETFTLDEMAEMVRRLGLRGIEMREYATPVSPSDHSKIVESFACKCDIYLDRIKGDTKFKKLMKKGLKLRKTCLNGKFSWAPELNVIGWK
jgi:ubiquinone/menaquinone biosynthesis C-methylase UbiE